MLPVNLLSVVLVNYYVLFLLIAGTQRMGSLYSFCAVYEDKVQWLVSECRIYQVLKMRDRKGVKKKSGRTHLTMTVDNNALALT